MFKNAREIKKRLIFKHVLDRTRGLVRLDDNDLEGILDIVLDDGKQYVDVKYYKANWSRGEINWELIRTLTVDQDEINRVKETVQSVEIGTYKYELPDTTIITHNVMLFQHI